MHNDSLAEQLQKQLIELEGQLAEAQATIRALQAEQGQNGSLRQPPSGGNSLGISEESLRQALLVAPYPLMIWREDGTVLLVNTAFRQAAGYDVHEIPTIQHWYTKAFGAHPAPAFVIPDGDDQPDVKKWREYEVTTRTGEQRIWDFSNALLGVDQDGRHLIVTLALDITERRQIEEQMQENEQKFSIIFEKAPFAAALSRLPEGTLTNVNEEFERVFGYTRQEVVGRTALDLGINPDAQMRARVTAELKDRGHARSLECPLLTKSGEVRTFLLNVDLVSIGGRYYALQTAQDITERKKGEQALRQSEERFAKAFHSSPDAIIISRLADGLIVEANQGWSTVFGHQTSEVLGKTSTELGVYVDLEDRKRAITRLRENGYLRDFEIKVRRKSGEIRQGSMSVELIEMNGEQYLLTTMRDITERKKAEEHIAYQARLLAQVNDAIVGSDAEYQLTAWNSVAESMYGWKAEEVLGRNGLEVLQTQWSGEDSELMRRRIAETGRWRGEATQLRKDGARIPVEVSSVILRDEQGRITGYVSVNRDTTERKQVEAALQASEAKMRAVFRALTEGVVFLNRDGQIEEANDAVQHTFGHTVEELSDPERDPRYRIIRPDGTPFPVEEQPAMVALRTGQTVSDVEIGLPTTDGKISWRLVNAQPVLNEQGVLLGVVASFFDITGRKLAEQALRESELRFRSLADSMPQLVWTALPDGRVDYYNERYQEYQSITLRDNQDWEWAPVLHPDDTQATVDAWLRAVETGEIYQIEHRVKKADGAFRWHLSRGVPMRDERGRVLRWFGTATDIHDLKLAEEQAKMYASRLEQSNRELEQFAFLASHDLQEPLRKIEMFGDLLLERAADLRDQDRTYLDRMRNAAGRMRDMIEGLLQISRVATEGLPFVQVNLNRVTAEALSDLQERLHRTAGQITLEPLPTITGDAVQLRQLMQNLIGNALKYHQPGKPPEVRVFAVQSSDVVKIIVEDQGIGFDQADADRIFEPFQRLVGRSQYEGSGIGLAICRRIVDRHGGEIAAISEPGHGTTFIVTLPVRPLDPV